VGGRELNTEQRARAKRRTLSILVTCLGLTGCVTGSIEKSESGFQVGINVPTLKTTRETQYDGPNENSTVPTAVAEFSAKAQEFQATDSVLSNLITDEPQVELIEFETLQSAAPAELPPAPAAESIAVDSQTSEESPSTLDFATALALVSGQNPRVAFAQERINEAFAQLDAACVLWLPSIRAGASYNKHEGSLQNAPGAVLDVSRASAYTGFGAQAIGTGSPAISGLLAQFHLADAIYQPIIAERATSASQYAADATTNDVLLEAALSYLDLLQAVQEKNISVATLQNAQHLVKQTSSFAKTGQGSQADADRAQTELTLRKNDVIQAEEAIQVASVRLAEVLNLEATIDIQPAEPVITPIDLVDDDSTLADLIATAQSNRPELSENRMLVSAAFEQLERERKAPFIPSLQLGMSYGGFGGGTGRTVDTYRDRFDFDALAFWEVRNLGFGEKAARGAAHARVHQAKNRETEVTNRVTREVAEVFAQLQSRRKQIAVAETGTKAAADSYRRNAERIHQGEGLPIEVLQSLQALDQVRREYLSAVVGYNEAQFRLHRALGWPIQ